MGAQDVYGDGVRGPGKQKKSIRQVDLWFLRLFFCPLLQPTRAREGEFLAARQTHLWLWFGCRGGTVCFAMLVEGGVAIRRPCVSATVFLVAGPGKVCYRLVFCRLRLSMMTNPDSVGLALI